MIAAPNVSIIDEDGQLGAALQSLLANYKIQVNVYSDTQEFINSPGVNDADSACLLLALSSGCEDGLSLVTRIKGVTPTLPVIVLCDTTDEKLRDQYLGLGVIEVVSKSMMDAYIFTRLAKTLPELECLPNTQASTMRLPDGTVVTLRMISPDDAEIEHQFVIHLSDKSRYMRFFSGLKKLPDFMLKQLIDPQFPYSYALIATVSTAQGERQIGVARYSPTEIKGVAEFAVVVADEWNGHGIATQLLRSIVTAATVAGIGQLEGLILSENRPMLNLAKKLGFVVYQESQLESGVVKVVKNLRVEFGKTP